MNTDLLNLLKTDPPYWAEEEICQWMGDDRLESYKPFARSHYWCDAGSLNLRLVVGTDHPDYQGKSWSWLLNNGKRMRNNLELLRVNPDYYHDVAPKSPSMYFISVDGHHWFIHGDGNHRTCIGRFFLECQGQHTIHGVSLSDWRIDHGMHDLFDKMQEIIRERRLPFLLRVGRETTSRADGPGWQREEYAPYIELKRGNKRWRVETFLGAARMREFLESSRFRRWHAMHGWESA
ncbi:MAG: hypothetical protein R8K47_04275 [Mariprofundaceae bacterium]